MSDTYIFMAILVMTALTFMLRAAPFIFRRFIEHSEFFIFIKDKLPLMVMLILVYYSTGFHTLSSPESYVKQVTALGITIFVHLLFRNFLLSICLGTASYLLLLNYLN